MARQASPGHDPAYAPPSARSPGRRAGIWYAALGLTSAAVFVLSDRPRVQAGVQIPIYTLSTLLLARRWWRARQVSPDPLMTLAVMAFGWYFFASIIGVVLPLMVSSPASVSVPSLLDGMFLLSYAVLALLMWRLGSRAGAATRRDVLDLLVVAGGVAPLFWVFLIQPMPWREVPTAALLTLLAYPASVFVLLCVTVRLTFIARRPTAMHLLLTGWIAGELSADVIYSHVSATGSYSYGEAWQALWILSATCVGTLALQPVSEALGTPREPVYVASRRRLWLLAGCLVTPLVTICYAETTQDHIVSVLFATLMSVCLVVLLCLRLSGLMGDNAAQLRVQEKMQRLSEALSHQAKHDPLTGLGNRLLFAEQVDLMLDRRSGEGDRAPGLLLLDLDDFKLVNDSFGHEAGDRVLTEISRRLQRVTRHNEWPFRLGGDEFAIVQASARPDEAMSLAHRVNDALSEPFDLGPRQIRQRASIGISIALQGQTRSTLLAEADLAMYAGKTRGRGEPGMFDVALYRNTLDRHELERDLLDAVARHEMRLLYQPLVSLASQSIVGVEALLRWEHPTRGTVGPQEFIPLAEVNGAILDLGEWVLREALQQLLAWDELVADRPLRMSVNVSPRELANPGFVDQVGSVLLLAGIDPSRVTLEITEAAFGADAEAMIERLHALKALGLILAIDDFGTEYSSLSRLRSIPFDVLKIDKSFVDHIASVPAERAVTATIVSLATSLGKTAVAEGVETEAQLAELLRLDVAYGQGYLFARPVGADAITELLSLTLEGASQLP